MIAFFLPQHSPATRIRKRRHQGFPEWPLTGRPLEASWDRFWPLELPVVSRAARHACPALQTLVEGEIGGLNRDISDPPLPLELHLFDRKKHRPPEAHDESMSWLVPNHLLRLPAISHLPLDDRWSPGRAEPYRPASCCSLYER